METALIVAVVLLSIAVIGLLAKTWILRRSIRKICEDFSDRIGADTNTLIDVFSADREIRRLTSVLNKELKRLRRMRLKYEHGDTELRGAAANISHDLRTPLTAISGYLELLEQEKLSVKATEYVKIISGRVTHLKQLTEELFKFSIIAGSDSSQDREIINLNSELADSLLSFYGLFKERGFEIDVSITEKEIVRNLSKESLSRIFGNIIGNAVKHGKGRLDVTLTEQGVMIFSNSSDDYDEVTVGRIFDRFYTVESGRNSTGLGLSIAKILTEQEGGSIFAESKNGYFTIEIFFPEN